MKMATKHLWKVSCLSRTTSAIIIFLLIIVNQLEAQKVFSNPEDLVNYAKEKSISVRNNDLKLTQAKRARLAAIYGIPDPSGSVSSSYTNNARLPVNFFPGELLGGEPGTFKEVQLGIQYVTNVNAYAEIKLLNLEGWENLRLSKINVQLAETDNKLSLKTLYENIAISYFNIVALQEELKATLLYVNAADTLYQTTYHKFEQGLVKQQDLNNIDANKINIEESVKQIRFLISQQYVAIKILSDIPENDSIEIKHTISLEIKNESTELTENQILLNNALYRKGFAQAAYRQSIYSYFPTISFFLFQTTQQFNEQAGLFDRNVRWIPSNYIGFRLSLPIPSSNSLSRSSRARFDNLAATNNVEKARIKSGLDSKELQIDYIKALSKYKSNSEIFALRNDSYKKNFNNYSEGIMSLEQTIESFNAMITSNYNLISSEINVLLAETKISINNKIN
jgi:outer membrane protein TolC